MSDVGRRLPLIYRNMIDEYVPFNIITAIVLLYDCSGCICNIYRLIGNCEFSLLYSVSYMMDDGDYKLLTIFEVVHLFSYTLLGGLS